MSASTPNPSVLQGLVFIKYLYNLGISQSNQPRPMKASCLLSFHDAVENFMGLACNKENISINRNITFDKYFVEYENATKKSISQKSEMNYLNNCRVSLKHYGAFPSDETVSKVKIDVSEFFENNTPLIFNTAFEELSMSGSVSSDKVKDLLRKSEDHKKEGRLADAVGKCAEALYVLIKEYKSNISKDWNSPVFDFGNEKTVEGALLGHNDRRNKVGDFAKAYDRMSDAITIIGFGIDYRKYAKFRMIAPGVTMRRDGSVHYGRNKDLSNITPEEFQFCYDFVIETALKLQEFAIDPDALSTTRTAQKARGWNEEARRMMAEQERAAE